MSKVFRQPIVGVFLGMEILLYILFLTLDGMNLPSVLTKYISICVCMAVAFYLLVWQHSRMIFFAMFFTLIADTFLLLKDDHYFVGVFAFCVVQTIYAARLILHSEKKSVVPRLMLFLTALVMLRQLGVLDFLTIASAWSFTQLIANVIHAFVIRKRFINGKIFAMGLVLFLGCDTCVGIHNLMDYLPGFPFPGIVPVASFCMWLFYLPAQVLIVLSFWDFSYEKEKELL